MKAESHSMLEACLDASASGRLVQVAVSPTHPLLLLKQALPWEALREVMTQHWRQHGKNVDGRRGLPWDVSLYVPLVVLMLIKVFDSRQMEAYVAENAVAWVFIGRQHDIAAQELPIGYPNEPGILRGLAQRCGRALTRLTQQGVVGLDGALAQVATILRSIKEHHLFTSGKADHILAD